MNTAPITVLVAEDHAIVRQGLCSLLKSERGFRIVGQAANGREAVKLARSLRPDVILMDIAMPVLNGFEATRQIISAVPAARVVILSAYSEDIYIERSMAAGASGFLEKQTCSAVLAEALQEAAHGRIYFSPDIRRRREGLSGWPKATPRRLSAREAEVLQLVAEGFSNKHMATSLRISPKTIEKHRQNVMNKLNIHDTAGLTRYAISTGVIETNIQGAALGGATLQSRHGDRRGAVINRKLPRGAA